MIDLRATAFAAAGWVTYQLQSLVHMTLTSITLWRQRLSTV